ncbi:hypothetical protein M3Y95_00426900 [Aphelenchoides besseyi]|nr:hypothetical protein M3Y95_00426900 [Aphelenchoides besseyi]
MDFQQSRTSSESNVQLPTQSQARSSSRGRSNLPVVQEQLEASALEIPTTKPPIPAVRQSKNEKNPTQKSEVDERMPITCLDSDDKMKVEANGATTKNAASEPKNTTAGNKTNAKKRAADIDPKADSVHVVKEELVKEMGSLITKTKQRQVQFEREINELPTRHEVSINSSPQPDAGAQVRIEDARCKLYETSHNKAANDEEIADAIQVC